MGNYQTKKERQFIKKSQITYDKNTPMYKYQPSFKVTQHKNGEKEIKLNNTYFIKQDDDFYHTIDYLVDLCNQKNQKDRHHLPDGINMTYFPSFQFTIQKAKMDDEKCMICLEQFVIKDIESQVSKIDPTDIYQLDCSHRYHKQCLCNMVGKKAWTKCPVCGSIFGKMQGQQPPGIMKYYVDKNMTCSGYSKGTIIINYNFQSGTNDKGVHYTGTSRTAYLPNNQEGNQVLQLLKQAFNRKLTFTVGRSVTTGLDNQVVWNGIHHKTTLNGGAANFGYPDPTYLKRVKQQLALKGIKVEHLHKKK